ncbi:MAG: PAS domain S-box protein [Desulfobacter sp.]|nr:MAG: PAS domain S-box protein [Desulfobacter sp.]
MMVHTRFLFIIVLIYLFFPVISRAGTGGLSPGHVLLLNSYNQRMTWVKDIVRAVEDELEPENNNLVLHIANMDSKQFHSPEYFHSYKTFLEQKYQNYQFSLILSSDNNAFDFLMKHRDTLFPGVPVVFCGVNNFRDDILAGKKGVTGVAEIFSARETVETALRLHPGTRELYIVNDYLSTGRAWQKDIENALTPVSDRVRLTYSPNLSMADLQARIAGLEKGTIVLMGVYFSDKDGRYFTYETTGKMIAGASKVPVYCLLEFNINKGVIGGEVISGYYQGRSMAQMGRRILNGESPDRIPVLQRGANRYVFDHMELERFGLREKDLPSPCLIVNRPYSVFREYKEELMTLGLLISILLLTIAALLINIFRRIQAEEALRKSEQQLSVHLNNTPVGAILWDEEFRVTEWNPAAETIFGYTRQEAMGKTGAELIIPEEVLPEVQGIFHRILSGVGGEKNVNENIKKTGERINCSWYNTLLKDCEGRVTGMATLVTDITEQQKTRELIIQSEKMMSVGGLAAGMAHEINNPLAGMIQSAQVIHNRLTRQDIPANTRAAEKIGITMAGIRAFMDERKILQHLKNITDTGNRAAGIIENMLSFVRKGNAARKECVAADLVNNTLSLAQNDYDLKKNYDFKQVEVVREYAPDLPPVACEESKIRQVLFNLIKNASQALTSAGTEHPKIILRIFQEEKDLCIEVEDNGPGMKEETRKRVFDPFFTTKGVDKGSGLGLSVAYFIVVEDHKGAMEVESVPGAGTKFTIKLPVRV